MPHLFADDDDTFALSDELERLINEHLPSPAAVLRAATYEMARALRHAPERYTVAIVEKMKSRMPVWIGKLRDGDLPPLKLATNIDSSALCYAMDKVLVRRKPRLGPTFDTFTELLCRVIVRCEDADITRLVAEACDGVTHLAALNRLLNLPRIDVGEWERCYHWLPNEDGDCNLLSAAENPVVRTLIEQHDQHYVWSQMDDPDSDGYLVLPGYWRDAIGWYLCERPWRNDARVVAVIEGSDAA
jgi:hypothetical protein